MRSPRRTTPLLALLLAALPALAGPAADTTPPSPTGSTVVLETTLGTLEIRLFSEQAPANAGQFERLVREGFYDGLPFYRVVAGHVIQAGDGGENDQPTVPLEPGVHPHVEGAVGMARDEDPGSGSTEFYICLADRPHLDGRYTIFGLVTDGLDVLRRIGAVEVNERWVGDEGQVAFHEPKEPVIIERATIEDAGSDAAGGDDG